ncbi:flagellar biosynthesis regulator FlaF [Pukyongiella litopenaei]
MQAYSSAATPTRTERDREYEAVAKITHRLRAEADRTPVDFPALAEALHDNKKLWQIFATDVSDAANPLPQDLKARIFYLAEFTHQHTSEVLARRGDVAPLLDINTAVMRGLRGGAA